MKYGDVTQQFFCLMEVYINCPTTHWCLRWEWVNGMIINSYYRSFSHSLRETHQTKLVEMESIYCNGSVSGGYDFINFHGA